MQEEVSEFIVENKDEDILIWYDFLSPALSIDFQ